MKAILAVVMAGLVLLVAGCAQPAPANSFLNEDAAASAATKGKIGVETWAMRGSRGGVELKGQTAAGQVLQELKVSINPDSSCDVTRSYRDSSGNLVASLTLKVDKRGKTLSSTSSGNPNDPALCPECAAKDLEATETSASSVSAQATPPRNPARTRCERAQRHLTQAFINLVNSCGVQFPDVDPNCLAARAAAEAASQEVQQNCVEIAPISSIGTPAGLRQRSYALADRRSRA